MNFLESHQMAQTVNDTTVERWRERWRRTGLRVRRFCQRKGLSEPSFCIWSKLLRDVDAIGAGVGVNAPQFLPVRGVNAGARTVSAIRSVMATTTSKCTSVAGARYESYRKRCPARPATTCLPVWFSSFTA